MVIDLREAQVFEGHMTQAVEGGVDIDGTGAHFFEERAQLILIHRKFQDSSGGGGFCRAKDDDRPWACPTIPAKEVVPTPLDSLGLGIGPGHTSFYMNTDNIPQICSEVGLTCESCTAETARNLAAVCKGLPGKMVAQLFVQIYPNSACAPMHRSFAAHYREATAALAEAVAEQVEELLPQRREVGSAGPRVMAAVA